MNALGQRIAEVIAGHGPISVAQFMALCQFDPQGGSYTARHTIGRDFITSPEISQTFGEMLGLWVAQTWHDQGRPENPRLVEFGPGRGTLMADALRAIGAAAPHFLLDAEVVLVEASDTLAAIQKEKLGRIAADIRWQTQFDDSLTDRPLYVIANEFFDCLPVHQFVKTERGWCERMVGLKDGALAFVLAPEPTAMTPDGGEDAPLGGVYETAPAASVLAQEIARVVAAQGGGALFVDYGYAQTAFGGAGRKRFVRPCQFRRPQKRCRARGRRSLWPHHPVQFPRRSRHWRTRRTLDCRQSTASPRNRYRHRPAGQSGIDGRDVQSLGAGAENRTASAGLRSR
jgi:SAM-dependent MidA family methyltransferase